VNPLRLLLADDHVLVRAGIRSLLGTLPGVEVVAEARDGHETLGLVESLHPDIVLMDIAMPGLNGLEATERITRDYPKTKVVILSMHVSEEYGARALRAGASGYLPKDADVRELELAIGAVARGGTYLSPAVSTHVVADYRRRLAEAPDALARLSPRQREVLQLLAEGSSTKEIAFRLKVSIKTVETHRAQIMDRLDIHDLAGLVRFAVRTGLVPPDA
jgi:DNA-binding NarL/FixJ family response regulator